MIARSTARTPKRLPNPKVAILSVASPTGYKQHSRGPLKPVSVGIHHRTLRAPAETSGAVSVPNLHCDHALLARSAGPDNVAAASLGPWTSVAVRAVRHGQA
jgi:hypothetical protein